MTYYGNKAVLESDDIAGLLTAGNIITLPDGRTAIEVYLVIDPASGKQYSDGVLPGAMHVTNGVNHRVLPLTPLADAQAAPAPADPEAAPEGVSLHTFPATDTPPTLIDGGPVPTLTGADAEAALAVTPHAIPPAPVEAPAEEAAPVEAAPAVESAPPPSDASVPATDGSAPAETPSA